MRAQLPLITKTWESVLLIIGDETLSLNDIKERMPDTADATLRNSLYKLRDAGLVYVGTHRREDKRTVNIYTSTEEEYEVGFQHGNGKFKKKDRPNYRSPMDEFLNPTGKLIHD